MGRCGSNVPVSERSLRVWTQRQHKAQASARFACVPGLSDCSANPRLFSADHFKVCMALAVGDRLGESIRGDVVAFKTFR